MESYIWDITLADCRIDSAKLAEETLRAAAQSSPDAAEPVVDLAQLLVRTGRGDQALPLLEKFTTRQPGNIAALDALFCNCSITRGDYAGAALFWMMAGKKGMRLA